ncbi:MAG: S8 family peptidase [Actinomycetota bacterium]
MKRVIVLLTALATALAIAIPVGAKSENKQVDLNVVFNTDVTDTRLAELNDIGRVTGTLDAIDVVFMKARLGDLEEIADLPFVEAVNPDQERQGAPIDTITAENFSGGINTWNLDAINVTDFNTDFAPDRTVDQTGDGVYVAVLDTGLVDQWRQYFPDERIAEEYALSFAGGGNERGKVSTQPNKWEHDTNSHGTHVTSTILGYSLDGIPINGVAPEATVIPVKVLGNAGFGWSSMVTAGINYVADLKEGPLENHPVVINMSLGGPELDAAEKEAIDRAIEAGVIIVASAGNSGEAGMGFPGAYEPVISAAASGWAGEWVDPAWWNALDVADPTDPDDFYITDFSSRELDGQDLDIAAPGSWVLGPFNLQQGQTSYFFLGGTSMASPHVAGTVALMAEKDSGLTASEADTILTGSAIPLDPGCLDVLGPTGTSTELCWGSDATGAGLLDAATALADTP